MADTYLFDSRFRCFIIGNALCTIILRIKWPCHVELTMPRFFLVTKEREKERKREEKNKKERNFSLSWIFISRKGILHFDVSLEGQVGSLRNSSTKLCDSPEKETVFSLLCDGAQPRKFLPEKRVERKEEVVRYIYIILQELDVFILMYLIMKKRIRIYTSSFDNQRIGIRI